MRPRVLHTLSRRVLPFSLTVVKTTLPIHQNFVHFFFDGTGDFMKVISFLPQHTGDGFAMTSFFAADIHTFCGRMSVRSYLHFSSREGKFTPSAYFCGMNSRGWNTLG